MKLGFTARLFPNNWRPALDEVAFAQQHGFQAMQLLCRADGIHQEFLGTSPAILGEALRDANITPVIEMNLAVNADGTMTGGRTPLDVLEANVSAIVDLGCHSVHWHMVVAPSLADDDVHRLECTLLSQLAAGTAIAQDNGFYFGFEHNALTNPLFCTAESCQMALDAVPNLKFVWDCNHTLTEDFAGFQALAARVCLLHVSDTPLPVTNSHLPLGQGNVDFAAFRQALQEHDFVGPAVLEIGGQPFSGGYGQDTDAALLESHTELMRAFDSEG